jgi:predicted nuclease of predicted toxin-antitoxin system
VARLYTNENFPRPSVEVLRELGHDVLTTSEAGKADQRIPDDEVLAFAMENDRILITFNRKDFIRLHNEKRKHAGIIICTVDADFPALAQRIHDALTTQTDLAGQLIRVNRPNTP